MSQSDYVHFLKKFADLFSLSSPSLHASLSDPRVEFVVCVIVHNHMAGVHELRIEVPAQQKKDDIYDEKLKIKLKKNLGFDNPLSSVFTSNR